MGTHQPEQDLILNTIVDFLGPQDICLDLKVADKKQLFDAIGRHMEREHALPQDRVVVNLSRREQIGSTGLGHGVAIPHARIKGLNRILALYVRLKSPIAFDAPDGKPVSDVLVLLVPAPSTDEHLVMLAEATQLFSDRRFRENLHSCTDREGVMQLFSAWPDRSRVKS
jgi:PTS system nitrogen regulatory IIA component